MINLIQNYKSFAV